MNDAFSEKVRAVLADTFNLPPEFMGYVNKFQALNPIAMAPKAGDLIVSDTSTTSVTSITGTTFATGKNLLADDLSFTAQGGNSYLIVAEASDWQNTGANLNLLRLNLDGADGGYMALDTIPAAGGSAKLNGRIVITPAAGTHTINAKATTTAGTATVNAGAGGAGTRGPIRVAIYRY